MLTAYISYQNAHGNHLHPVPKDRLSEAELLPTLVGLDSVFTQKESQNYQGMAQGKAARDNENLWQVRSLLGEWKFGDSWLLLLPLLLFLCFGSQPFPSPSKWAALCLFPPIFFQCPRFPHGCASTLAAPRSSGHCPCHLHGVVGTGERRLVWGRKGRAVPLSDCSTQKLSPMGGLAPKLVTLWRSYGSVMKVY